jgi:hypothetical protein
MLEEAEPSRRRHGSIVFDRVHDPAQQIRRTHGALKVVRKTSNRERERPRHLSQDVIAKRQVRCALSSHAERMLGTLGSAQSDFQN